jgi:hypothetical protein
VAPREQRRQQKAANVRAGHKEHQDSGSQQHEEQRSRVANHFPVQRKEIDTALLRVGVGIHLLQSPADGVEVRLRALD